jgi:hypothetical protein
MQNIKTPKVVNVRSREFDFAHHDGSGINITRKGPWGNPFAIGRDGDRETVIAKFADWLSTHDDAKPFRAAIRRGEFVGKTLGCACKTGESCHGHVIAEFTMRHARHSDRQVTKLVAAKAVSRGKWIAQTIADRKSKLPEGEREFRLIVAGSRSFSDKKLMLAKLDKVLASKLAEGYRVTVISGGADGADKLGELWAHKFGHGVHRIDAPWHIFGKSAGHIRNEVMAGVADACIVFWDGKSAGTKGMIDKAEKAGIPTRVVNF